jgi:branched-chain amino acid transport system ATP-binding protein
LTPLLEVKALRTGYGRSEVLHGVDLVVPPASTVVLLGPNGAGKTTLLKTIAGLLPTWEGRIAFGGDVLGGAAPHRRARQGICLIPEGRGIFRHLTVAENLLIQGGGFRAETAIERVAGLFPILGSRLSQPAGSLSGGQQQMLALARAFLTDAPLVLGDELSMGLAPVVVDEIFEAIRTLQHEGRSLLLVEQFVERAVAVSDYVYILVKGTMAFAGEPGECTSGTVFARYLEGAA